MRLKEWAAFWTVGILWGTSFLWIKIALREIGPASLVAFRFSLAALGMLVVLSFFKQKLPKLKKDWLLLFLFSLLNPSIPVLLISWAETRIASSMASILNGTVPLFTIVIAHLILQDEKITLSRTIRLIIGFLGVMILSSGGIFKEGLNISSDIPGQLAVLVAAGLYAYSTVFSRKYLRGYSPIIQSSLVMIFAAITTCLILPFAEPGLKIPHSPLTWLALVWLSVLGICVALSLYFYVLNAWGATRATLVNYVFPVVGLVLGVIFLGERVDTRLILGSTCIVGSIFFDTAYLGKLR